MGVYYFKISLAYKTLAGLRIAQCEYMRGWRELGGLRRRYDFNKCARLRGSDRLVARAAEGGTPPHGPSLVPREQQQMALPMHMRR